MSAYPAIATLLALGALVAAGCQSTQDKSDEIAGELGAATSLNEKGLKITKQSTEVEPLSTELITDEYGSVVVVELRSSAEEALTNVPIAIDVLDKSGKSVYRNDIPGIEPALAAMPMLAPGATAFWVHNQILATGEAKEVEVEIGASTTTFAGELPDIEVSEPAVKGDPVSGVAATGTVTNNTDEVQKRVLLYGVARDGEQIVAAGRAAIENLKPGRTRPYDVFFIGDPEGAEVEVTSFPTLAPN